MAGKLEAGGKPSAEVATAASEPAQADLLMKEVHVLTSTYRAWPLLSIFERLSDLVSR